jgi:hypothetical protein
VSAPPAAVVVGGGLAGLVAALRLAQGGCTVDLYEAAGRTGGKSGSDLLGDGEVPPYWSDHGYHVFPAWYTNTWALLDDLHIRRNVARRQWFLELRRSRVIRLERGGWRLAVRHRPAGLSPRTALIAIDLVATKDADLVDVSLADFVRSRTYRGRSEAKEFAVICMKALGLPPEQVSARAFRTNMRLLIPVMVRRNWNAATGSLQERLICPIQDHLEAAGVRVHTDARLVGLEAHGADSGLTVTALDFADGRRVDLDGRPVVLAVPYDAAWEVLKPHAHRLPEELRGVKDLKSAQLVALDVHLRGRLAGFPRHCHVILEGSPHHLTVLDIRDLWTSGLPGEGTVLQVVAAEVDTTGRTDDAVVKGILDDLFEFFPWVDRKKEVVGVIPHLNATSRLFVNSRDSEADRPRSDRLHGTNLLVAGDWCMNPISLACMEGAVVSGAQAAGVLVGDHPDVPAPRLPKEGRSLKAKVAFWSLRYPIQAGGWLWDRLSP